MAAGQQCQTPLYQFSFSKLCFAQWRQRMAGDRSAASCVGAVELSPTSIVAACQRNSQGGREGGRQKKKYIVLILGVSNNSGNKDREKRSTKANQWRWGLFYVATGHFSAWVMDVSLLRGWWQQHDSKSMVLDILYILYGALSLMLPRGSENQRRFNKENIVVA